MPCLSLCQTLLLASSWDSSRILTLPSQISVREPGSIEHATVGDVPATIPQVVDGETVALRPLAIQLADKEVSRGIVVRRLNVLWFEHIVGVSEVRLRSPQLLSRLADARNGVGMD